MAQDRVSKTILQYTVDQASVNKVLQSTDQMAQRLKSLGDKTLILSRTNEAWARSMTATGESIRASFEKAEKQVTRLSQRLSAAKSQSAGNYNALRDELMGGGKTSNKGPAAGNTLLSGRGLNQAGRALNAFGLDFLGQPLQMLDDLQDIGIVAKEAAGALGVASVSLKTLSVAGPLAAVAVTGVALAVKGFNDSMIPLQNGVTEGIARLKAYYQVIEEGTTASINAAIRELEVKKRLNDTEMANLMQAQISSHGNDVGGVVAAGVARLTGQYASQDARIKELSESSKTYQAQLDAYHDALTSGEVAANDAAEAEKKLAAVRDQIIEKGIARDIEQSKLLRTTTPEQVKDLVASREDEIRAIRERMGEVDKESEKYKELETRLKDAQQWLDFYNETLWETAYANKAAADAAKKSDEAVKKQADYISKQNEDVAGRVKQYNDDVKKLETDALQARADIQQRYNDKIVDLARTAADEAAQALTKLETQRADLLTGLNQDLEKAERDRLASELDTRLSAAREDEKAARDHYQELQRIRDDAADREFDMILNRDFLALFQSRRQTTRDLLRSNADYQAGAQERQIATAQQIDDIRRQAATERSERLIAYQQQLADAQTAYNREIQQSQAKHQAQLQLAYQAYQQELTGLATETANKRTMLRQNAVNEINMARMTADARIKFLQAEQDMLLKQAYAMTGAAQASAASSARNAEQRAFVRPGGIVRTAAAGAMLGAGDLSVVHGGEAFSGLGLLYALQGGAVTNNFNSQFSISGNNPEAIWHYIEPKIAQTIERIFS